MPSYSPSVSIHRLFALLVALSVVFAPNVTSASMAAAPHHDMQMMAAGHCSGLASNRGHDHESDGKSCCISTCTGVAVAPNSPPVDHEVPRAPAVFAVAPLHLSYLGEIATPPPRSA